MKEYIIQNKVDSNFVPMLIQWYKSNARDLPWRKDREPYHVWISEIMLQQTRVETVKSYYMRFLNALPDIPSLADVSDEILLKLWEGLGYYSRAHNLKKAAHTILNYYDGKFPTKLSELCSLPGIGPYTAGAIASICFDQPTPAVDGNVLRVFARLSKLAGDIRDTYVKKAVSKQLEELYPNRDCGAFTQALMELGAMICIPNGTPLCGRCPVSDYCAAYHDSSQADFPIISPKKKRRIEERTVYLLYSGDELAIVKRPNTGLLAGLWEFPNISGRQSPQEAVAYLRELGAAPQELLKSTVNKHIFTHIEWHMTAYSVVCGCRVKRFQWAAPAALEAVYALPSAFRQFIADTSSQQAPICAVKGAYIYY